MHVWKTSTVICMESISITELPISAERFIFRLIYPWTDRRASQNSLPKTALEYKCRLKGVKKEEQREGRAEPSLSRSRHLN